jgi:substrate-binding family protein
MHADREPDDHEAEVAEMGAEAAEGHITAAPFFETLSSPAARRFVSSFKERYGTNAPVTAGAEASYFQLHLAMRAVAKCGSDDPEQVLANLRDAEFDAPQGRVRIDPENNHTYLWPLSGRGLRGLIGTVVFRPSGIPGYGSSRTLIASCRVWTTGQSTTCSCFAHKHFGTGAASGDPNPS